MYEVAAGVWSFDRPAPNRLVAPPRAVGVEAPDGSKLVRDRGETLLRCKVDGKDKLVSAAVAVSCANRGLHGFRPADG